MRTAPVARTATLLAALLVLTACSGADDVPDPDPTTADAPPDEAFTDLCDLVDPDLTASAISTPVEALALGRSGLVSCDQLGTVTVEYGYSLDPGVELPALGEQVTSLDGFDVPVLQQIDVLVGDEDQQPRTLWAERDGAVLFVRNDTLPNTDPADVVTVEQTEEIMRQLLERATPEVVDGTEPTRLPQACPAADDAAVAGVVGTVSLARGARLGDEVQCQYVGTDGLRADLSVLRQEGAEEDFVVGQRMEGIMSETTLDGAREATISDDTGTGTDLWWSTAPDTAWSVGILRPSGSDGPVDAERGVVDDLADAFVALNPDMAAPSGS